MRFIKNKKLLKDKTAQRVVFHEITKQAVLDAVAHPRDISQELVNAQQARRVLEKLYERVRDDTQLTPGDVDGVIQARRR